MAVPDEAFLAIGGRVARADIPNLCERARALAQGCDGRLVVCDVGGLTEPDAAAVDLLARISLIARRLDRDVRLRRASSELLGLLDLMGLAALAGRSALEHGRQAEEREQARGVEEEADPADPPA